MFVAVEAALRAIVSDLNVGVHLNCDSALVIRVRSGEEFRLHVVLAWRMDVKLLLTSGLPVFKLRRAHLAFS